MNGFRELDREADGRLVGLVETPDGALIHVAVKGHGRPLVLLHGWSLSSVFWRRQFHALSDRFRVVAPDLRGHGNSSKVLQGHTIPDYARDLQCVLEALDLRGVVLVGWSLAGCVALEHWQRFGEERVAAFVFVEMTPFPMSSESWNTHPLRGANFDALHGVLRQLQDERAVYAECFLRGLFQYGRAPAGELSWMLAEQNRTPTAIAMAIYSDYAMRDYGPALRTVRVPSLAVYGNAPQFCLGPNTGSYLTAQLPQAQLLLCERSGHMPFYEEPEVFNRALASFARAF